MQQSAMAAVSTNLSGRQGVVRQPAGSADETVTEVLGICGFAGGRRPRAPHSHFQDPSRENYAVNRHDGAEALG